MLAALARALVPAVLLVAVGCGDGSGGGVATCEAFGACGGDPTGRWTIVGLCPTEIDTPEGTCEGGRADPSGASTSGSFEFDADGSVTTSITLTGELVTRCPLDGVLTCGSPGTGPDCAEVDGDCECHYPTTGEPSVGEGTWEVSGGRLEMVGFSNPFCVTGDAMVVEYYFGRLELARAP